MVEQAGTLRERLRFEERSRARGPYGEQSDLWRFVFARWAEVKPLARGSDPLPDVADTRHVARKWQLTIRAGRRPALSMRVRWQDELLSIIAIDEDPARPGWLFLQAEEFAPTGS